MPQQGRGNLAGAFAQKKKAKQPSTLTLSQPSLLASLHVASHLPEKQQAVVLEAMHKERVFFRNSIGKLFSLPLRSFSRQATSFFFPS